MSRALWPTARTATSAANMARAGHGARGAGRSRIEVEVLDPAGEPDLAAELLELPAQGADDQRQAVRAEVRALLVDDRGLAVAVGQDLQDALDVGAGAPAGQLAVAEGARPSLAEEVVALGVERPAGVEPTDVGDPVLDGPAAFEDQRPVAVQGEHVPGEQPRRAGADDHRPVLQGSVRSRLGPLEAARARRARRRWPSRTLILGRSGSSTSAA